MPSPRTLAAAPRKATKAAGPSPSGAGGSSPPPWVGAALILAGALSALYRTTDFDYWFHLAAGRSIALHGLPSREHWCLAALGGPPWLPEWLFQVALWKLWSLGGDGLVTLWRAAWAGLAVALALRLAGREPGAAWPAALLAPLILAVARDRQAPRPEQLAMALALLFLSTLESARRGGRDRTAWLLLPQALWANMHASWVLGPAFAAAYALCAPRGPGWGPARVRGLALAGGLAAVSALSPRPYDSLRILLATAHASGADPLTSSIDELRRWSWSLDRGAPFTLLLALALLALPLGGRRAWRASPPLALAALGGLGLGLLAVRFRGLAAFLALPALAAALATPPAADRRPAARALAAVAALTGLLFLALAKGFEPGLSSQRRGLPVVAARLADSLHLEGPVLNTFHYGGYLLWARGESHPPLIDGRGLGSVAFRGLYAGANARASALDSLLAEWRFTHAVLEPPRDPRDRFAVELSRRADWCLVFADDAALLYLPRDRDPALCETRGYRWFGPDAEALSRLGPRVAADPAFASELAAELERARAESQWHARASFWLGLLELTRGRAAAARALLDEVERLAPLTPGLALRQGLAHEAAGDANGARRLFRRALRDPDDAAAARERLDRLR